MSMGLVREGLVERLLTTQDDNECDILAALLVMYDHNLLNVTVNDMTGNLNYAFREDATEEQIKEAQEGFEILSDADEVAWMQYVAGEIH
jgi:hypothetical protein